MPLGYPLQQQKNATIQISLIGMAIIILHIHLQLKILKAG
jgi:hypothetical protein